MKLHHAALCLTCILQMLNTHQSLAAKLYRNIVPSYIPPCRSPKDRQIAERYKLSWQKVMLESLCNTGCICSGVVRGDNNAKKVTHYSPFNCMLWLSTGCHKAELGEVTYRDTATVPQSKFLCRSLVPWRGGATWHCCCARHRQSLRCKSVHRPT